MIPARSSMFVSLLLLALSSALPSPCSASGRSGSLEIGFEGALTLRIFDYSYRGLDVDGYYTYYSRDNEFRADFPVKSIRVGFYASDVVEIEPTLGLTLTSENGNTIYSLSPGLNVLYNFLAAGNGVRPYLSMGGGLLVADTGYGPSRTQGRVGGGLGLKLPFGDRHAFRLQGGFTHSFDNDHFFGYSDIALLFGYSFFTR